MNLLSRDMSVFLVTSNIHKFNEARRILGEHNIATAMLKHIKKVEIQDDKLENVAKMSAADAYKRCKLPTIVEDAGLFIDALGGFPGPYSSFVFKTIGCKGIIKLMKNESNRKAHFKSVVAFFGPETAESMYFVGEIKGSIVEQQRGTHGFGFDPVFEPFASKKTFAEIVMDQKNRLSHRSIAFHRFAEWFLGNLQLQKS
ncbi:MAG: XTP/dITP diphosphatase [Candidatus Bathyarchaeota archaeon]|nr:XTP/dITP diphosphatase [Candidatus Bathyarchaeota archaeon]